MKRTATLVSGLALVAVAFACGGNPSPQTPQPDPDSIAQEQARRDSIERARREAAAREDSIRQERQRVADSIRREEDRFRQATERARAVIMEMIHFDFDKSDIRTGDAEILDRKLEVLRINPQVRIRIAGHADERGSDEYNIALGNRRANAAKQYLVSRGIDASRIDVVSFGEERPLDPGSNEAAWARNRRDEFEIIGGGERMTPGGD